MAITTRHEVLAELQMLIARTLDIEVTATAAPEAVENCDSSRARKGGRLTFSVFSRKSTLKIANQK